jgi:GH15 family glucan-1,4-alpha-glucosidase
MTYGVPLEGELQETSESFLRKTVYYWQNWIKSTSIGMHYQKEVIRSSLALKIHQYEDTGGIIASPTMSLPESDGSTRNWDYRYCWMRDSYYTLTAFNNIGHFEEMEKYFLFLSNLPMSNQERIQPLYDIVGQNKIIETELDLPGYLGNKPVRLGNDAYTHIQNDVYGQILLAILPLYTDKRFSKLERSESLPLLDTILDKIAFTIDEADAGLWEFRNLRQKHAYTHLFQWAGSHAACKIAKEIGALHLEKKAQSLQKKAQVHLENCYLADRKAYAQAEGVSRMDASTLQLIMMNYLPHDSQKAKDHLKALEEDLRVGKGLFYRYKHADDFGEPETTFLICAFWYVEALACVNRTDEAMEAFEEIIGYSNHVGLLSEDVKSTDGSMWGNFPQAYSHVGLVNAAYRINNKLDKPDFLH